MRKRILRAAMKLFLQQGFENVSMRKIAAEIGYSTGAIYRYFAGKDEIFFALRGEGFERFFAAQMAARTSPDPATRLRRHAEAYLRFALDHREYYELMFLTKAPIERATERAEWAATSSSLQLLRDDLSVAMQAGILRSGDVDSATFAFWSLAHGMMALILRRRLVPHSCLPDDELARGAVEYILESLICSSPAPETQPR